MAGPEYHARTHLPGGTDPLAIQWSYITGTGGLGQSVTANDELELDTVRTNDSATFGWDEVGDPDGLLIKRSGLYAAFATVQQQASDVAVAREIYVGIVLQSLGALGSLGSPFGEAGSFFAGVGQLQAGMATVTAAVAKASLSYMGIGHIPVSGSAYYRAAVILDHKGTNFTLNAGAASALFIFRIADTVAPL